MLEWTVLIFVALAAHTLGLPTTAAGSTKTLVAFGDSYTDQSRSFWFVHNNSYPPPHFTQSYPPQVYASDGGSSWPRYVELYGGLTAYNYAVSGAACSNLLTPRPGMGPAVYPDRNYPSVMEYEVPAFVQDWGSLFEGLTGPILDPETTVYSLWIGTNDVGVGAMLTDNQTAGVTIVNTTQCAIEWMNQLYSQGARRFLLQNMIPLQLTPAYAPMPEAAPPVTWSQPHNRTFYSLKMEGLVKTGNALWDKLFPEAISNLPGSSGALFSSYDLFWDMYHNPSAWLNGTEPLNVTGYYASDARHQPGDPDSYLWWNDLHPSEQANRNVAREIVATLDGTSKYATYFGDW